MNVIYYVEVNLICIVLLLLFGNLFFRSIEQQSSVRIIMDCIMIATVLFCICDMLAGIFRGRMFYGARTIIIISNWLFYELLVVIGCLWFFCVWLKLHPGAALSRGKIVLFSLPLLIYTLAALTNFYNGFLFTINEQNLYVRGQGIIFHWIVTWGYLLASTVKTVHAFVEEESKMKKNEIRPLMYFIIAPTAASVVQMLFYGVTSTQVGITLSIVMICISNQNAQILTDPLTKLNNRRGLDSYLDSYLGRGVEQHLTFLMIDINGFKKVNDTYGHVVGDRALVEVSRVLKESCREVTSRLFICRYGGDEFVIAGDLENDESIMKLKNSIYRSCEQVSEQGKLPCPLTVSIGYASGNCRSNSEVEHLLSRADASMYREKTGVWNK